MTERTYQRWSERLLTTSGFACPSPHPFSCVRQQGDFFKPRCSDRAYDVPVGLGSALQSLAHEVVIEPMATPDVNQKPTVLLCDSETAVPMLEGPPILPHQPLMRIPVMVTGGSDLS